MHQLRLPVFPLGTVLFPNGVLPLHIFEQRYRRMLSDAQNNDPAFVIALLRRGTDAGAAQPETVSVGTACRITGVTPRPDGRSDIVVSGTARVHIGKLEWSNGYAVGAVEEIEDRVEDADLAVSRYTTVRARFARYLHALELLIGDELPSLDPPADAAPGTWLVGETLTLHTWERQGLLEAATVDARLAIIDRYLQREYALLVETGVIGSTVDFPGRRFALN